MRDLDPVPIAGPPPLPSAGASRDLLPSLGRLMRGLAVLFWALPLMLVIGAQTARGDWLRPFNIFPATIVAGLTLYGLLLLGHFQRQERVWRAALDTSRALALVNLGLAPFLYWWSRVPSQPFFVAAVIGLALSYLAFLFSLNPLLCRLTAMLPDETLRLETRAFTTLNRALLVGTLVLAGLYFGLNQLSEMPRPLLRTLFILDRMAIWCGLFLILLPMATTMALIWKIKEVIFTSVFVPPAP